MEKPIIKDLYNDAARFSLDINTQIALLQAEWARSSEEYTQQVRMERALKEAKKSATERGLKQGMERGIERGIEQINSLNAWLFENNRTEDVIKATSDPDYRAKLFKEYGETHPQAE